jgi:hypothetical protein
MIELREISQKGELSCQLTARAVMATAPTAVDTVVGSIAIQLNTPRGLRVIRFRIFLVAARDIIIKVIMLEIAHNTRLV